MASEAEYRKERIERLIHELEYELTRGVLDHEIEEDLTWRHCIGISHAIPDGVVMIELTMRPMTRLNAFYGESKPRLRLVKKEEP